MRHLKNWYAQRNNIDQRKETARKLDPNEMAQQQAEPKDCDRTTEQNQRTSPLLRLPPELRNRIYGYVFEPRVSRVIFPSTELGYTTWPLTTLGACRQIRYEASPICFANITFDLRPFKYNDNPLEILALGPFVSVTVKDGTANFLMDVTRSASEFHYAALFRERVKSLKRIYITAPGGAEVELAFDKESGLCKYGV